MGHTFLNSYKSVWLLNDHNPGTLFGNSNCSLGLQYSTKPPSSAEMTQSNLSLYYLEVSDHDSRSHYKNEKGGVRERTVIKWTGNRWSFSTVSNGLPSPRPS